MDQKQKMSNLSSLWDSVWAEKEIEETIRNVHENSTNPCIRSIRTHLPFVKKILANTEKGSLVLEAGCGTGEWVFYIGKLGYQTTGIDLAYNTLKRVKKYASQKQISSRFIIGDIRRLPFRQDSFNCVLSLGVIEHFPDPKPLLKEMYRVLQPGESILITVPNVYCSHTITRPVLKLLGKWNLGYEGSYSPAALKNLVQACKLEVKDFGTMPGGEIFGTALKYIPIIGFLLYQTLSKISFFLERKTNALGFWSYAIAKK